MDDLPFVTRAIARKRLFVVLSVVGVLVGLGLGIWWAFIAPPDPSTRGLKAIVVVLVLLNARGNLRQFRYASALEKRVSATNA